VRNLASILDVTRLNLSHRRFETDQVIWNLKRSCSYVHVPLSWRGSANVQSQRSRSHRDLTYQQEKRYKSGTSSNLVKIITMRSATAWCDVGRPQVAMHSNYHLNLVAFISDNSQYNIKTRKW